MESFTAKKRIKRGGFTYSLMGTGEKATHIHINNTKTNNDSVFVPIEAIKDLLESE